MSSFVKDFSPDLAFVSESSQRCNPQASGTVEVNTHLSKIVTYVYMASKYLSLDTAVVVPDPYHTLLSSMFGGHSKLVKGRVDMDNVILMDVVNYDASLKHGETLMPLFVSTSSTHLHNIYDSDASAFSADTRNSVKEHIEGCLNFFNTIVRSTSGLVSGIVWKDPVSLDTKLQKHTYDQMFAIYVCDMYLRRTYLKYPNLSDQERLATALSCFDVLQEESKKIKIKVVPAEQRKIASNVKIATPKWPLEPFEVSVAEDDPELMDVPGSYYYASILAFLSLKGSKKASPIVIHIYGNYSTYSFVGPLAELFVKATINVYCDAKVEFQVTPRVKKITTAFTMNPDSRQNEFIVSTLPVDKKIPGFYDGFIMVLLSQTTYTPTNLVMPLYTASTDNVFCIINGGSQDKMDDPLQARRQAKKMCDKFNREYRDTRIYKYVFVPKDSIRSKGPRPVQKTITGNYDDSYVRMLRENISM